MGKRAHAGRLIFRAALVSVFVCGASVAAAETCKEDAVRIAEKVQFSVEIADEHAERSKGLMHRTSLPSSAGMLFLYDRPQILSFWMRDTLIELDLIFVDGGGIIRKIHHKAIPLDETPITGGVTPLMGVLEINGGLSKKLGLQVGDKLFHPKFGC